MIYGTNPINSGRLYKGIFGTFSIVIMLLLAACDSGSAPDYVTSSFQLNGEDFILVDNVADYNHDVDKGVSKLVDGVVETTHKWKEIIKKEEGVYIVHYPAFCEDGDGNPITRTLKVRNVDSPDPSVNADFTVSTNNERTATFTNMSTVTNCSVTPTYRWNFGDGTTSDLKDPQPHTYAADGNYEVKLVVSCAGVTSTATKTVNVSKPVNVCDSNSAPVAGFTFVRAGLAISFESTATDNQDSRANLVHAWSFGDGNSAGNDPTPQHPYGQPGTYTVTQTVTDSCGGADSSNQTITVEEANEFNGTVYLLPAPSQPSGGGDYVAQGTATRFQVTTGLDLDSVTLVLDKGSEITRGQCVPPGPQSSRCLIWKGGFQPEGTQVAHFIDRDGKKGPIRIVK